MLFALSSSSSPPLPSSHPPTSLLAPLDHVSRHHHSSYCHRIWSLSLFPPQIGEWKWFTRDGFFFFVFGQSCVKMVESITKIHPIVTRHCLSPWFLPKSGEWWWNVCEGIFVVVFGQCHITMLVWSITKIQQGRQHKCYHSVGNRGGLQIIIMSLGW